MMKIFEVRKIQKGDIIKRFKDDSPNDFILLLVVKKNSRRLSEITSTQRYTVKILKKHYNRPEIKSANNDQKIGDIWHEFVLNEHHAWSDKKLSLKEATLEVL